MLFFFF